jgi:hypothetical protein
MKIKLHNYGVRMQLAEKVTINYHSPRIFYRLTSSFQNRKTQIKVGIILLLLGVIFFILGIRQISAFEQLYFYWSFTYVNPLANLTPGFYPGFPLVVRTYEILIPWVLMGIVSFVFGLLFVAKGIRKYRFGRKRE